ncbi:hypothetical protein GP486_008447, partial [Trichoglossum hirsutum]
MGSEAPCLCRDGNVGCIYRQPNPIGAAILGDCCGLSVSSNEGASLNVKIILVLGFIGAGKSSLVKLLTGMDVYVETGLSSGTKKHGVFPTTIDGQRFVFIDTPGFDDLEVPNMKILEGVTEAIANLTRYVDVAGVLYVHDIQQCRLQSSIKLNLEMLRAFCGKSYYPNITFVTTKWDSFSPSGIRSASKRQELWEKGEWEDIIKGGARVYKHYGVCEDDEEDERNEAMERIRGEIGRYKDAPSQRLQIQEELESGVAGEETTAAKVLRDAGLAASPRHIRKSWWRWIVDGVIEAVLSFFGR